MPLDLGLAGRTAALLLGVATAVSLVAGALVVRQQTASERRGLEVRATALADALERSLTDAMAEHRPATMKAIVHAVAGAQGIRGLALLDGAGHVRAAAGDVRAGIVAAAPSMEWSPTALTLVRPVANAPSCRECHGSAEANGTLFVSMDAAPVTLRVRAVTLNVAALVGALLLATALVVVVVLRITIARPLAGLRRFAQALGRGDLSARPPPTVGAEVGALARALKTMADEVQRAQHDLESRVEERTAKLAEALAQANAAREERSAALTRLQAIIDSMADGVLFIDADNKIALVNRAGRVLRNVGDERHRDVHDCHPKGTHATLDRVLGYLRNGNDTGPAHPIIKERDGRFETTYAPVRNAEGAYLGTVMVIRDIGERRRLERRLLDAERLAGLGQMSAQVAHELRNPLNAIDGAAQYLRRVLADDAAVAEYTQLIDDEVQRVNRFITELLSVARPAAPAFTRASINKILREAAQRTALARSAKVALTLAEGLPDIDVDPRMVMEALVNLLDNAFDAGGESPPELVSWFDDGAGEGTIVVEVRDRGCGIPAEQLDEVQRPFVTTKTHGTGLGLVVVRRAVEQNRARFELAARAGGGTIARLRFPVRRVSDDPGVEVA